MTALSFAQLPLAAGSAVLASAVRLGGWALARYLRAPLASTAVLAMLALSIAGAAHALYFESGKHPAPLFHPAVEKVSKPAHTSSARPKHTSARRPVTVSSIISAETTGSVAPASVSRPIRHEDVEAVQRKLAELSLFSGRVDGYYGPRTAAAIRAFERQAGLPPVGALNPEVVEKILHTSGPTPADVTSAEATPLVPPVPAARPAELMPASTTVAEPAPSPAPVPPPASVAALPATPTSTLQAADAGGSLHPKRLALGPLPAPTPELASASRPASAQIEATPEPAADPPAPPQRLGRVNPAAQLLDAAGETAEGAVDALAGIIADVAGRRDAVASAGGIWAAPQPAASLNPRAASTDPALVTKVQRGLASLGFLAGRINGVADEPTARAIRNFQIYYDYPETGRVTPELLAQLQQAGAIL